MMSIHRHWQRLCRTFGFKNCREAGAAEAASYLGVDRQLLRMHYDVNLTATSRHALDAQLLAYADAKITDLQRQLADAVALRHDLWVAEQNSEREKYAVDIVEVINSVGERETWHFLPHESILKELFEAEFV